MISRSLLFTPLVLGLLTPAAVAETSYGGSVVVAAPTGAFDRYVGVAGGLAGQAFWSPHAGTLGLRLDGSWLLYGSETVRTPLPAPRTRLNTEITTDNWIAQVSAGPELRARRGAVRPYVRAFLGVSYFSTTSELTGPEPVPISRVSTNLDDTVFAYGAGAGLRVPLRSGAWALDLGVDYVDSEPARFLTEGDLGNGTAALPRRAQGSRVEFHVGFATFSSRTVTQPR